MMTIFPHVMVIPSAHNAPGHLRPGASFLCAPLGPRGPYRVGANVYFTKRSRSAAAICALLHLKLSSAHAEFRSIISARTSFRLDNRHCAGGTKDSGKQEVAQCQGETAPQGGERRQCD